MDIVTHALLGALTVQVAAPRDSRLDVRERMVLGGGVAMFPDVDFIGFPVDPLSFLADWHQGVTHSLLMLPIWASCAAALFVWITGRRKAFIEVAVLSALALLSHIMADLVTVYGTRLLAPASDWRAGLGLVFVIDPLFTSVVAIALVLAFCAGVYRETRRRVALLGATILVAYVCGLVVLKHQAGNIAEGFATERGISGQHIALPQPFSPFNWTLLVVEGDRYHRAHVNLLGHRPLVPDIMGLRTLHGSAASYRAVTSVHWEVRHRFGPDPNDRTLAERLWRRPEFDRYRRFAVFPGVSRVDRMGEEICVWFTDLRYDLPGLPDTFRYAFCRVRPGEPWKLYRLRYLRTDSRQPLYSSVF